MCCVLLQVTLLPPCQGQFVLRPCLCVSEVNMFHMYVCDMYVCSFSYQYVCIYDHVLRTLVFMCIYVGTPYPYGTVGTVANGTARQTVRTTRFRYVRTFFTGVDRTAYCKNGTVVRCVRFSYGTFRGTAPYYFRYGRTVNGTLPYHPIPA